MIPVHAKQNAAFSDILLNNLIYLNRNYFTKEKKFQTLKEKINNIKPRLDRNAEAENSYGRAY
jgi:hypothetical protein